LYKYLTYEEFSKHYKPILNKVTKYPSDTQFAFETFGEEYDFVSEQGNNNVWTEVDGDGGCYIIAGLHFVNRIQYYVTEKPWDNENQEVVVQLYKECDNCGCLGGYGTDDDGQDCLVCSGTNADEYNVYPDTRQDLIELYGDEANEVC
jgi:hypothetical protein